jgi:thiol-disulfide isomerase/thioredoxin
VGVCRRLRQEADRETGVSRALVVSLGALVALIALLTVVGLAMPKHQGTHLVGSASGVVYYKTDVKAPSFKVANLSPGAPSISLSSLGGKPLIIDFWASWCPDCRKEIPELIALYHQLSGQVRFLGVDTDDHRAPALSYAKAKHIPYLLGYDPNASLLRQFAPGVLGLPTTVFVSPKGVVVERVIGALTTKEVMAILASRLGVH